MKELKELFDKNQAWAEEILAEDPNFFTESAKQQNPEYLWIGCSDSRVDVNTIIDAPPGDVLVHRNIANMVVHTDMNCLSVLQFAVEVLKVKHIIVCGHYGCGGIKASMEQAEHGLMDIWLRHIKDVSRFHADTLADVEDEEKFNLLCELNVREQVRNVCNSCTVQDAWKGGNDLTVHGWIYDIKNGRLKDMDVCVKSNDEFVDRYIHFKGA